jgi:hypothetical protein
MPIFPEIRIGQSVTHPVLTVFALFADAASNAEYLLADEAIAAGTTTVEEVNHRGSVPDLLVENKSGSPVLFLEGEELRGAKQNRVLNTSVFIGAASKATIPVSCVEPGRWRYTSRHFASGGSYSSSKLRHILKKSVDRASKTGHGHQSDQGEVWMEVGRQMVSLGSQSPTGAMADTYDSHRVRLAESREQLKYVDGAFGLAVAVGSNLVSVDLFDKSATCRKVWDRLLSGLVLDALESATASDRLDDRNIQEILNSLRDAPWHATAPAGVGEEFRADRGDTWHASVLSFEGTVLHGCLITV